MRKTQAIGLSLILVGVLALALVGCGETATAASAPSASQVTAVRALLVSDFPSNHIPPFNKTSINPAKAQTFYKAFLALPKPPNTPSNEVLCPVDWGTVYHLTFTNAAGKVIATGTVESSGCEFATLPNGSKRWAPSGQPFWNDFAAAMNVSEPALHPMPKMR